MNDELLQLLRQSNEAEPSAQSQVAAPVDVQISARGQAAELQGLDQLEAHQVEPAAAQAAAALGFAGEARDLPHLDLIQAAFGNHDIADLQVHLDELAKTATDSVQADALVQGASIAFGHTPDVREAAREAARTVWQREGDGTVDAEQAGELAEVIADRVAEGRDAEALLDRLVSNPATGDWRGESLAVGDTAGWSSLSAPDLAAEEDQQQQPELSDELGWAAQYLGNTPISPALDLLSEPPLYARKRKRIGDGWLFDPVEGAEPNEWDPAEDAEQEFL